MNRIINPDHFVRDGSLEMARNVMWRVQEIQLPQEPVMEGWKPAYATMLAIHLRNHGIQAEANLMCEQEQTQDCIIRLRIHLLIERQIPILLSEEPAVEAAKSLRSHLNLLDLPFGFHINPYAEPLIQLVRRSH